MKEKFKELVGIGFIGFDLSDLDDTFTIRIEEDYEGFMHSSSSHLYKKLSDDYYSLLKRKTRSNINREIFLENYSISSTYHDLRYRIHKNFEFYRGYLLKVKINQIKEDEQKLIDFIEFIDYSVLKVKTLLEQNENFDKFTFKIAHLNHNIDSDSIHIYLFDLNKTEKLVIKQQPYFPW